MMKNPIIRAFVRVTLSIRHQLNNLLTNLIRNISPLSSVYTYFVSCIHFSFLSSIIHSFYLMTPLLFALNTLYTQYTQAWTSVPTLCMSFIFSFSLHTMYSFSAIFFFFFRVGYIVWAKHKKKE